MLTSTSNKDTSSKESIRLSIDGPTVRRIMPHGYPFQMFDKVQAYDHGAGKMIAIKNVCQNDPFIQGHFPGNPIFPGVLIIEALAQTAGCGWIIYELIEAGIAPEDFGANIHIANKMATVLVESKIKHTSPVFPGDQILLEAVVEFRREDMCRCKVVATVDGREASKGQVTMARIPWTNESKAMGSPAT